LARALPPTARGDPVDLGAFRTNTGFPDTALEPPTGVFGSYLEAAAAPLLPTARVA